VHCELIMYGRSAESDPKVLLPGWMESDANSALWSKTPINGIVGLAQNLVTIINHLCRWTLG
jgi:hypothetical protein